MSNDSNKQNFLKKYILLNIFSKQWPKDTKLHSKGWFAYQFGVSESTIKKVFKSLLDRKYIYEKNRNYYISDIRKKEIANENWNDQFLDETKIKRSAKIEAEVTSDEMLHELTNWKHLINDAEFFACPYVKVTKAIHFEDKKVRENVFFYPKILSNHSDQLAETFVTFLALNGYIPLEKNENISCIHDEIIIFEILKGLDGKVVKIGYYKIPSKYFNRDSKILM